MRKVKGMEKRLYRVTMVFWKDARNTDTDYITDFSTKEQAMDYVNKHRKHFERQARDFKCDDDVAVDMDIEEWVLDEDEPIEEIGIVYSIQLWEKPKSYYQRGKQRARQIAIDLQHKWANESQSYYELSEFQYYLTQIGRRYGLLKEFKENGIL